MEQDSFLLVFTPFLFLLSGQEAGLKRFRRTRLGYLRVVDLSPSSLPESPQTAARQQPVGFRGVCEKWRRGVLGQC